MILAGLLLLHRTQDDLFTFNKDQLVLSEVIDELRNHPPKGVEVDLLEPIPSGATSNLKVKDANFYEALEKLAQQSPIRFLANPGKSKYFLSWSQGVVPKSDVRLYRDGSSYELEVSEAPVGKIAEVVQGVTGANAKDFFSTKGIPFAKVIKNFKSGPREGTSGPVETADGLLDRLMKGFSKETPQSKDRIRSNWNLTFLPGNPPDPGSMPGKIDFGASGPSVSAKALADALTSAYQPRIGAEEKAPAAPLVVSPVGNTSLSIEGEQELVGEVRRLLATQLDIPQSQILLELDTYQVSSDVKGRFDAERAIHEITLAQEIARAYKNAHYSAIEDTLLEMNVALKHKIKSDHTYAISSFDLFAKAGMATDVERKLSLSELLSFLAYASNKDLSQKFPTRLSARFDKAHLDVDQRILKPLDNLEKALRESSRKDLMTEGEQSRARFDADKIKEMRMQLTRLDSTLQSNGKFGGATGEDLFSRCAMLSSIGKVDVPTATDPFLRDIGSTEDRVTQSMLKEFLILWVCTAYPETYAKLSEGSQSSPEKSTIRTAFCQIGINLREPAQVGGADPELERLQFLLSGDRTANLSRASARLDALLGEGVKSIQSDSANLVDRPLSEWIDQNIVSRSRNSRFGVQFGGTTTLAVTSRSPGRMGSETESFFPYQPVAPLSLGSLTPLLSRTPKDPAADATDAGSALRSGGATSLEAAALQAIFDQAAKPSYDRKLGTGIFFSVLPTMLPNGTTTRLQVKLNLSVSPDETLHKGGVRDSNGPAPIDLIKSSVVETELLANAFDITLVSSLKVDVSAPSKRDWEIPVLSQVLPFRSWFVGPTQDKTVRHEAIVLVKVSIVPSAMDLASRSLGGK